MKRKYVKDKHLKRLTDKLLLKSYLEMLLFIDFRSSRARKQYMTRHKE